MQIITPYYCTISKIKKQVFIISFENSFSFFLTYSCLKEEKYPLFQPKPHGIIRRGSESGIFSCFVPRLFSKRSVLKTVSGVIKKSRPSFFGATSRDFKKAITSFFAAKPQVRCKNCDFRTFSAEKVLRRHVFSLHFLFFCAILYSNNDDGGFECTVLQ